MKATNTMLAATLALSAMFALPQAHAHITFERKVIEAASWSKFTIRVPEGCSGSPTAAITVEIPDAFYLPRPMHNGTWKLDVVREKLAKPIDTHGMQITEKVRSVTWSGKSLPDDFYEEFVFFAQAPKEAGRYPVKVTQICEKGRIDWHEIAKLGQTARDLKAPAPVVVISEKTPASAAK